MVSHRPSCETRICTTIFFPQHPKLLFSTHLPTSYQPFISNTYLDLLSEWWWQWLLTLRPKKKKTVQNTKSITKVEKSFSLFVGQCVVIGYGSWLVSYSKVASLFLMLILSNKLPWERKSLEGWVHDEIYWEIVWASQDHVTAPLHIPVKSLFLECSLDELHVY